MLKKIFILSIFLIFTNCGAPGTALLGPAVTGVTTKSAARSSVSFGSNQIIRNLKDMASEEHKEAVLNLFK